MPCTGIPVNQAMSPTVIETQCILEGLVSMMSSRLQEVDLEDYYQVVEELGSGSFGSVLMAKDKTTDKTTALKLLKKSQTTLERFLMEHYTSFFLSSHSNIIGSYGVAFQTIDHYVFAQEWSPVGDLFEMIEDRVGIPEVMAKRCAVQIASALDFIGSKGLVHCDVKPENILLFDEDCHCVKVNDFGLTCLKGTPIRARSGTSSYMSPELCRPREGDTLHAASSLDAWAFGVLLFCVLSGYFPWEEAVPEDSGYNAFVNWMDNCAAEPPPLWEGFTTGALSMFRRLLALDPNERINVLEIMQFVDFPWKADNQTDCDLDGSQSALKKPSYESLSEGAMSSSSDGTDSSSCTSGTSSTSSPSPFLDVESNNSNLFSFMFSS
ncbi:serine/threonine-protein kinase SBK1-like isoform X3 [Lissotriton helveticus]